MGLGLGLGFGFGVAARLADLVERGAREARGAARRGGHAGAVHHGGGGDAQLGEEAERGLPLLGEQLAVEL